MRSFDLLRDVAVGAQLVVLQTSLADVRLAEGLKDPLAADLRVLDPGHRPSVPLHVAASGMERQY